ncbi:ribulose-phosphate 3-epimerase [Parvularcula dongshanensis]|uniref:Ribulose-phosphate 3-epimerase n=1 Tax=Parvularcula dongshanensis TaxID=1173995 RepID=A0A840I0S8_9PROT|nr:ribulose-phosphate 3-epimerase [Parvularcula dongshanensis]MBB4657812.1 ribulose-phosphate 3-epimerase [Parvularcula dongshanensis]
MLPLIAPSILSADFAALGDAVRRLDEAGADMIHIDVMDGHFVPNLTFGPGMVRALRPHSALPFDVHLMIEPVAPYLEAFAEAGADTIHVHAEAGPHLHSSLQKIKALGKKAGVAINPATSPDVVGEVRELCDVVLVMSVNPGFGGQVFLDSQLRKIERLRAIVDEAGTGALIEIDGGVTPDNADRIVAAGATALVAGSAVFAGGPSAYAANIQALRAHASRALA